MVWLKAAIIVIVMYSSLMIGPAEPEPGATTAGDTLFPHLGNGGYDVQHYDLNLAWDDATGVLSGTGTLTMQATQDLTAFTLDLAGLTVSAISVDNQFATFEHNGRKLTITPARVIANGQTYTTTVTYSGIPQPDATSGTSSPRGWNRTAQGVYIVSEPSGGATWFPGNDHPTDKATFTLRMTVRLGLIVAASGLQQEVIHNGATVTHVWQVNDPTATYLLTLNIGDYIVVEGQTARGLPLRSYFPNTAAGLRLSQRDYQLEQIIDTFSDLFGIYPFEAYGILLESGFPNANEMQTLPIFHVDFIDERVMVHEAAHQWFGNHVTLGDWSDIWLNEGFATYAEFLYAERVHGVTESNLFSRGGYNYVRTLPPPAPTTTSLFPATIYHRGGWTLHALRLKLGDDVFFNILRTYYARFGGSHAYTEDFIAVAEELSGQDLQAFFQGWLYDPTPPPVPELE
jgi:aminopeptidase N